MYQYVLSRCRMSLAVLALSALLMLSTLGIAQTNINISFVESAPTDRFVIENTGTCTLNEAVMTIDLSESAGGLIFDTTAAGAGVEVFQPFNVAEGNLELFSGDVVDGNSELTLRIVELVPGARASFTIDVDDTLTESELGMIRVTASEIAGAVVSLRQQDAPAISALFDDRSQASLVTTDCL